MQRIVRLPGMPPVAAPLLLLPLLLAACGGGSSDDSVRLSEAKRPPATVAPGTESAAGADTMAAPAAEGVVPGVVEGEAQESAGAPPVAPHPTRLVILEDGLYARDAGDNWKKYENGSWVSVHAPQLPSGTQ